MAVFILECETVTSASNSVTSLISQMTELSSSVSGYDTSNDDGFDFDSAKSVISSNLEACSTKLSNAKAIMEAVVSSHTQLQNSLKFGDNLNNSNNSSNLSSSSTGSGSSSNGASSSGEGGYSSSGGGGYSGGGSYAVAPAAASTAVNYRISDEDKDVETKLKNVSYAYLNTDKITDNSKKIIEDKENFKYDDNGYAMYGDKYLIACDESVGKVGDIVKFTKDDGTVIECVVGTNTTTAASKNTVNFLVDKNTWGNKTPLAATESLLVGVKSIKNVGKIDLLKTAAPTEAASSAIDWAITTSNDRSIGYSQSTRWGNPNYDCSSFVITAYEKAGVPVKSAGASYTGNMRSVFTKCGFKWVPGTPNVNDLQPGDVLLNESHHTEMYIGDGKLVGAHSNYDGVNGDSSGKEISVQAYSNKNWDGYLRYVGKK